MKNIARIIDNAMNPDGERNWGFVFLNFPLGPTKGSSGYMSNVCPVDAITHLRRAVSKLSEEIQRTEETQ